MAEIYLSQATYPSAAHMLSEQIVTMDKKNKKQKKRNKKTLSFNEEQHLDEILRSECRDRCNRQNAAQ